MSRHRSFIPRSQRTYANSPEAVMAKEFAGFTPWKVDCTVYQSLLDPEGTKLVIFCRAPDPAKAMHSARILWGRKIKEAKLRKGAAIPEFPKMSDRHDITCLDDADYMAMWKEAQDWPRVWAGQQANPISFLFFPDKLQGLIS